MSLLWLHLSTMQKMSKYINRKIKNLDINILFSILRTIRCFLGGPNIYVWKTSTLGPSGLFSGQKEPTLKKSLVGLEADWFYLKTDKGDIFKTPATECTRKKKEWGEKRKYKNIGHKYIEEALRVFSFFITPVMKSREISCERKWKAVKQTENVSRSKKGKKRTSGVNENKAVNGRNKI